MNRTTHHGRASALPVAAAFVAIGGRLLLSPKGKLEAALDAMILFDPQDAPEATRSAYSAARAMTGQLCNPRAVSSLKCLVLRQGERTPNGWLVVEAGR